MSTVKEIELNKEELPEGWTAATLADVASYIQRGKSPKYTDHSELPIVNQKCIRWHGIDRKFVKYIHPDQFEKWEEKRFLQNGDLLWNSTGTGTIGRAAIVKLREGERLVADSHVTIVRSAEGMEPKYVHYWVMGPAVQNSIEAMQSGSTNQVELSKGAVETTPIPVAPPEQQKRIVAKIEELFSHIDAGIAALVKAKRLLKQYRQSVLKAAVTGELTKQWREDNGVSFKKTWRSLALGEVVEVIDPNPSHRYPPYDNGDVPLMATKQMKGENDWDASTAKLTTREFYEQRKSIHGFDDNDIIFARKGRLGLARRPPILDSYAFSHTLFIVRGNDEINSNYLLWYLRREEAISWLLNEMNVGAGVPTLGKGVFQKLPLRLPEINEQVVIGDVVKEKLSAIERTQNSIHEQLLKVEKNKQSILSSAFSGQLL